MSDKQMIGKVLNGQVVNFPGEPLNIQHWSKGAVAVGDGGRIAWCGDASELSEAYQHWPHVDYGDMLIMPGFIDAHIHFPQYRMLAAPAKDLMEWLHRYTFPEEARYADSNYAVVAADIFLSHLFSNGTTSALAFSSVHKTCADALFAAASKHNMALITGKTMMDRNAITAVQDTPEQGARESVELYQKWHCKNRLRYAVTPRFAVTSSEEQLHLSGELLQDLKGALLQTHISESPGEIALVKQLFPNAEDYTDVYDRYGLLGPRSVFAHGIHLNARERKRFSETGSSVIHCPTSNAFLGSGIMPMKQLNDENVHIGVATDIGGGTSYSMLATLAETYKLQMLAGYKATMHELFHMATLGNATRLHSDAETGSLAVGKFADIIVLDPTATPVLKARQPLSNSIEDLLFALMMLGDDRAVHATYVAGAKVHG
jgi:guanine deaminase